MHLIPGDTLTHPDMEGDIHYVAGIPTTTQGVLHLLKAGEHYFYEFAHVLLDDYTHTARGDEDMTGVTVTGPPVDNVSSAQLRALEAKIEALTNALMNGGTLPAAPASDQTAVAVSPTQPTLATAASAPDLPAGNKVPETVPSTPVPDYDPSEPIDVGQPANPVAQTPPTDEAPTPTPRFDPYTGEPLTK